MLKIKHLENKNTITKIKTAELKFITEKRFNFRDSEKLRGYFGSIYKEEDLFHNHDKDGKSIYRMPLIQYKVIDGMLTVIAYNEAVKIVAEKFIKVKELIIDNEKYFDFETQLNIKEEDFFVDDNLYEYIFYSLWLPINQKNYLNYINKKLDLNKVMQNNMLSNFKGLGLTIDKKIMAKGQYNEKTVKINNIEYFGFTGFFMTNVKMPDYISIGQMRAIGFGSVKRK